MTTLVSTTVPTAPGPPLAGGGNFGAVHTLWLVRPPLCLRPGTRNSVTSTRHAANHCPRSQLCPWEALVQLHKCLTLVSCSVKCG